MRTECGRCGSSNLSAKGTCRPCNRDAMRRHRERHPDPLKGPRKSKYADLDFPCEGCGSRVIVRGADRSVHEGQFCSPRCAGKAHLHSNNPNWRGGIGNINGYNWVRLSPEERVTHTCCVRNGKHIPTHRYRAELALGRCLKPGERVHHINGNKLDNRNSNLLVCDNAYHGYLHAEMSRRWQQENFGDGLKGAA